MPAARSLLRSALRAYASASDAIVPQSARGSDRTRQPTIVSPFVPVLRVTSEPDDARPVHLSRSAEDAVPDWLARGGHPRLGELLAQARAVDGHALEATVPYDELGE